MRFLLDENFPKAAVAFLESHGHEATRIASGSDRSLADEQVFEAAQEQAAILLTTDRDFYHTVPWKYARGEEIPALWAAVWSRPSVDILSCFA